MSRLRRVEQGLTDGGASFSGLERNHLFINRNGRDFTELSGVSGLDSLGDARTSVRFDFNRDGYPDIGLVNANSPLLSLYRNNLSEKTRANHFIAIRFKGGNRKAKRSDQWSSRDGYGARVYVKTKNRKLLREHRAGEGFAGQNSATMLVGLGEEYFTPSVEVHWPSGRRQEIDAVIPGTLVTVYENPRELGEHVTHVTTPYRVEATTQSVATNVAAKKLPVEVDREARLSIYVTVATWCNKCRNELTRLEQLSAQLAPGSVATFAIPIDPEDTPQKLKRWKANHKLPVRLVEKLSATQRNAIYQLLEQRAASAEAVPATIIADQNGAVRAVFPGAPTLSQIKALLDS